MPAQLDLDLGSVEARSVPKAGCRVRNRIFYFYFYFLLLYCPAGQGCCSPGAPLPQTEGHEGLFLFGNNV